MTCEFNGYIWLVDYQCTKLSNFTSNNTLNKELQLLHSLSMSPTMQAQASLDIWPKGIIFKILMYMTI